MIAVGARADIAIWDTHCVELAGSWDPAALVLAGPSRVKHLLVEGRQIVRDGQLTKVDVSHLIHQQNKLVEALMA